MKKSQSTGMGINTNTMFSKRRNSYNLRHNEIYSIFIENDKREEKLFKELCYNIFNL
jgi:hypothetical protein